MVYSIFFVSLFCIYTSVHPMSFERIFTKHHQASQKKSIEFIKSIRMKYDDLAIKNKKNSSFEEQCGLHIEEIIQQEIERQKKEGKMFVPTNPLVVLEKISFSSHIKKIIKNYGQQCNYDFMYFYRRYKNVRGAWNVCIANIVIMEDMYG